MSEPAGLIPNPPSSAVRNTVRRGNEQVVKSLDSLAFDVALREYCDKYYHQLLPIIAEKVHQEKVQQEKLKEVKARLNFEGCSGRNSRIQEVLQHSMSRTLNVRGEHRRGRRFGRSHRERKRDGGVFNRLKGKEKNVSAHSESRYQSSRSKRTEPLSESEDSRGGHWKLRSKKQKSSIEEDACLNHGLWFDDLPPESIDSYDDLKKAFLANFLQQKKFIKDPLEIHHIKQREGESTEDFVQRFKAESKHVKGAPECMRISGFMHGITNPELFKGLHDSIPKSLDVMMRVTTSFLREEVAASN
ncbi:reverse transcriptase domain-containing protein [Tanacetum coccineum]